MWISVAVAAYFINAGVYAADKFLLSKKVHSSITYAFYVGIWSVFNIFLLFFDPWFPSDFKTLALDLSAGVLFLFTLIFWYKALHQSEATRVVPIVGALVPIFSFWLSYFLWGEAITEKQFLAFFVLIIGGILISIKRTRFYHTQEVINKIKIVSGKIIGDVHAESRPTRRLIINSLISAIFFAIYYVLIKYIYLHQPFIGSFVWSRMGSFLGVLVILFIPRWRQSIVEHQRGAKTPKNMVFFLSVRIFAALAFIMLNWAISLGNVALVNSLQGVQYIFLILLALFLSAKFPKILKEELGGGVLTQKMIGVVLVGFGLYLLL